METPTLETRTPEKAVPAVQVPKKKRKWPKRVLILAIIAAAVFLLLPRLSKSGGGAAVGSYIPATASFQELSVTVSGTGTITPIHAYRAVPLVRGEVLEAPFEEGDTVHKGDLLFRLDSGDLEATIRQQELNLRSAQLNYETLLSAQTDNGQVLANADGVITRLYVKEGDAVAMGTPIADILDRDNMKLVVPFHSVDAAGFFVGQTAQISVSGAMETLTGTVDAIAAIDQVGAGGTLVREVTIKVVNPGALSDTSTGSAIIDGRACAASGRFEYGASKQVVAKTSGMLSSLTVKEGDRVSDGQIIGAFDNTANENQLAAARLSIEGAELALQTARDQLENYTITSAIDGTVIEKNYDVGDTLDMSAASSMVNYPAIIYDLSALTFDMSINELDISKIKVGQKVEITASALEGRAFTGIVDKVNINGITSGGTTTYLVTILVDGAPAELYPGMNVSASILMEDLGAALCIPVEYVSRGSEGGVVLVAGEGCLDEDGNVADVSLIETRQVTLGRNNDDYIEILDGLSEGEIVLRENQASSWLSMVGP